MSPSLPLYLLTTLSLSLSHTHTHTHTHTVTGNQQGGGENLQSEEAGEDEVSEGEPGSDTETEQPHSLP